MPQNTPMKRQFTTIDGRTVMSNLPQHWGGNDWAITGVDNPLPVGNYVQTEAGVWIPQKGSDDGAADVRLTGSKVVKLDKDSIEVTSGSTVEITDTILNIDTFKIGLGIRLNSSKKFKVQFVETHVSSLTAMTQPIDIINSEAEPTDRAVTMAEVVSTNIRVFVQNNDTTDFTISRIFIVSGN